MQERTALLTKLDSSAIRLLFGKKCKYNNFGTLVQELSAPLVDLRTGDTGGAAAQGAPLEQQIVNFTGGAAHLSHQLLDLGIKPGSWVQATAPVPDLAEPGVGCVREISEGAMVLLVDGKEVSGGNSGFQCDGAR